MGKITINLALLIAVALLTYQVGYRYGVQQKSGRLDLFALGSLTTSLSAIQAIRAQDYSDALRILEMHTYSLAITLIDGDLYSENLVVQDLICEVANYRERYAAPAKEWSAAEKMLEDRLNRGLRGTGESSPDS